MVSLIVARLYIIRSQMIWKRARLGIEMNQVITGNEPDYRWKGLRLDMEGAKLEMGMGQIRYVNESD